MKAFRSFMSGLLLPREALVLIARRPRLWAWSIIPMLITISLTIFGITWGEAWLSERLSHLFFWAGISSEGVVAWVVTWSARLVLILVGALSLSTIAGIIASPFNDFLAEETEAYTTPLLPPAPHFDWKGRLRLLILDLGKNLAVGLLTLMVLLASWIPFVNIPAFALAMLLLTFQYTSFPQTRRGETLGAGLLFIARHPSFCLGYGMSLSFLFAIPVISAFVIPVAVVGGTLLVARAPSLK